MKSPTSKEWKLVMQDELESTRNNQVWDLEDLPPRHKTVETKWVLKVKRNAEGSIERYRAWLMAKSYTQREGIDYEATISLVVKFASIRLILTIVAHLDLKLYQMGVKTAFHIRELDEETYIDQLVGFIVNGKQGNVYKLWRSIYGLKQSAIQWYFKFHQVVTSNGFMMIEEDHCVYVKRSKSNFLILSLYADDILLGENNKKMIVATQGWLSSKLKMKSMSEVCYVLGVKILRDRSRKLLCLFQETYIKKILERFQMQVCKPVDTPVEKGSTLSISMCPQSSEEKEKLARVSYSNDFGSLMYAMMYTRPDICHAVGLVSRFQAILALHIGKHWSRYSDTSKE